jgi:DNA primase
VGTRATHATDATHLKPLGELMNIISLLEQDGISAKKAAGTNGGEYASRCPGCGGKDRFRSWPEQGDGGKWWCRGCGKSGDLIQYLREFRGMSFKEACLYLGQQPSGQWKPLSTRKPAKMNSGGKWSPKASVAPADTWLHKAKLFLDWAIEQLWSDAGKEGSDWLSGRGISEATAKAFHLGWNPQECWLKRAIWGVPEELNDRGRPKKLWIPGGLVIPVIDNGTVHQIRIRRSAPDADPRYILISGSSMRALVIPGRDVNTAMVLESALDAILVHQEADDLVTTVALGSAQMRPDEATTQMLRQAKTILISLDSDDAGAKAAWQWWTQHFTQAKRWPPVRGKDPAEMRAAGVAVRDWVLVGLSSSVAGPVEDSKPDDGNRESPSESLDGGQLKTTDTDQGLSEEDPDGIALLRECGGSASLSVSADSHRSNEYHSENSVSGGKKSTESPSAAAAPFAPKVSKIHLGRTLTHSDCLHFRPHPKYPETYIGDCTGTPSNGYKRQWPFNEAHCAGFTLKRTER